jgi:hypothetical protein
MDVRNGVLANRPATTRAVGTHHAIRLLRVLPSQSLELWSDIGVQQGSIPSWIGGHGTEPYEQKTQQLPGNGFPLSATLTVVKEHAGVRGHSLGCLMAAMRASQSGLKLWFRHAANVAWQLSTFQVLDGLTRSTPAR